MSPTVRATARRNGIFGMLITAGFPLCETSLLYCPRLIQSAGYDSFGVRLSDLLVNGANRLIGTGSMVVVLCSLETACPSTLRNGSAGLRTATLTAFLTPTQLTIHRTVPHGQVGADDRKVGHSLVTKD